MTPSFPDALGVVSEYKSITEAEYAEDISENALSQGFQKALRLSQSHVTASSYHGLVSWYQI